MNSSTVHFFFYFEQLKPYGSVGSKETVELTINLLDTREKNKHKRTRERKERSKRRAHKTMSKDNISYERWYAQSNQLLVCWQNTYIIDELET